MTIIQDLGIYHDNHLFMKREDLIPFSFGGNKARKALLFFHEIDKGGYDCVVTYGSGSSNHCRVVANECCRRGLPCYIISPEEASEATFNSQMMDLFGAEITVVPVTSVHDTIEHMLSSLRSKGMNPYFIEGGGHGNIGTEAYVECYREINEYEKAEEIHFDYVFFASGTGTTQAGLVCGQLTYGDTSKIVGISIARKNPRGRNVVIDSIRSYLGNDASEEMIQEATVFNDEYTSGYGADDKRVEETIELVLKNYGIPLDATYTGKAFMGMTEYLSNNVIKDKNVLFLHTGGTPLFFDSLRKMSEAI
jgi:D-cysteine desulfhydrase